MISAPLRNTHYTESFVFEHGMIYIARGRVASNTN